MLWIIGFFTVVLLLDSLFLILLVLVQLPKKEAGLGQAFGSSATDALFGAGSGNALTKMTKYATGIFFGLTLAIYLMYNHHARSGSGAFARRIQEQRSDAPKPPPQMLDTNITNVTGTKTGINPPTTTAPSTNKGALLSSPQAAPAEATPTPATPPK
jgi:preprotein translocase subunit SecG